MATSNKQLNFVEHILMVLKPSGRAAVVLRGPEESASDAVAESTEAAAELNEVPALLENGGKAQ